MDTRPPSSSHRLTVLLAITALCYAVGYPLALVGHSTVGWLLVALGGPLLLALGVVVIRRVHLGAQAGPPPVAPPGPAGPGALAADDPR